MTFIWENYRVERTDTVETVEKLFDREAMRFTGCDDGFKAFYDYWYNELGGESFWCKTVFLNDLSVGGAYEGATSAFHTEMNF